MTESAMYNTMHEYIHQSVRNTEDLFCAMKDEGIQNLDTGAKKLHKIDFSKLGVTLEMNNQNGDEFYVIVMQHANDDAVSRTIICMAESIRKNSHV